MEAHSFPSHRRRLLFAMMMMMVVVVRVRTMEQSSAERSVLVAFVHAAAATIERDRFEVTLRSFHHDNDTFRQP